MTVTPISFATRSAPHLHEPFLERASGSGDERGHALGAFLTLRLVDRMADDAKALKSEALAYQLRACMQYIDEIYPQTEEVTHLQEIVRVAESASQAGDKRLLWAPMLAYAFWLEQQLRLEESLDVLDASLRLGNASAIEEKTAAQLQRGRVLRLAGRFDDSQTAYAIAGELANLAGDWYSEMVSRIGRAKILQKTGDLPASEQALRTVLFAAQARRDLGIEARACHDLSLSFHIMGRRADAVSYALRAFEKYEEPALRARALSDVGMYLKELGHYSAARDAFLLVIEGEPPPEVRVNVALELLELTATVQDRVGFERWRREIEAYPKLPPHEQVDFRIKLGTGLAIFGNEDEGINHVSTAARLAEQYKLNQRLFEAEHLVDEMRAGRVATAPSPQHDFEETEPEVKGAIDRLCALRAAN